MKEVGYANMSMDMLADEVGIAKATLYQHFSNKDDVIAHTMLHSFNLLEAHMQGAEGTAIDQLESTLRYMLTTGHNADGYAKPLAHDEVVALFRDHEQISQCFQKSHRNFDALINHAKAEGDIASDLSNEVIITMMFGMLHITDAKTMLGAPYRVDEIVNHAVRIFLQGVRPSA